MHANSYCTVRASCSAPPEYRIAPAQTPSPSSNHEPTERGRQRQGGTDLPSNPYPVYVAHRWHACCQPATGHRDRWDGSTTVPLPPTRPRANQVPWCTMQHSEPLPVCPCGLASMLCCPIDSAFKILYFFITTGTMGYVMFLGLKS